MIQSQFMQRTIMIGCGDQIGTAFVYDRGGCQYLITARHLVASFGVRDPLKGMHDKAWKALPATLVGHGPPGVDVSVFAAKDFLFKAPGEKFSNAVNIAYSQDLYFLGFPFGLFGDVGAPMGDFPLAFVKKAILSSMGAGGPMYLDGINNKGFSGGPVIGQIRGTPEWAILGVISGYRAGEAKIRYKGNDAGLVAEENTGLIVAYHIAEAHQLIDANPIGKRIEG